MKPLILMYVYYDQNGDIKAITPSLDNLLAASHTVSTFPINEVEAFLTSQKNPFDYQVKEVKKGLNVATKIVRKETRVVYTRTLDNYLTEVEVMKNDEPIIRIINDIETETITIEIDKSFKLAAIDGTEEEQADIDNFVNRAPLTLYFTKKHNPYHLLHTVTFSPKAAFEQPKLFFEYNTDLANVSVYTKKVMNSYGYVVRGKRRVI